MSNADGHNLDGNVFALRLGSRRRRTCRLNYRSRMCRRCISYSQYRVPFPTGRANDLLARRRQDEPNLAPADCRREQSRCGREYRLSLRREGSARWIHNPSRLQAFYRPTSCAKTLSALPARRNLSAFPASRSFRATHANALRDSDCVFGGSNSRNTMSTGWPSIASKSIGCFSLAIIPKGLAIDESRA